MADTPQRLAERLSVEGEKVAAIFSGLSAQQWEMQIYSDGACWTVRQILAHLDVTEVNIRRLIENILSGGGGVPENFNLNDFNERTVAACRDLTPEKLLERFAAHRRITIELVNSLTEADLERSGRHPFLGVTPLADIIKLMYRHNQIHVREMRRVLSPS